MKKRFVLICLLFVLALQLSSCKVETLPHWYYYYGGKYTFMSPKYYRHHKHWGGGRAVYSYYRQ